MLHPTKQNIFDLADFIEEARYAFDMFNASASPTCGTAGCIGGHAAVLFPAVRLIHNTDSFTFSNRNLGDLLGLGHRDIGKLCFQPIDKGGALIHLDGITRSMAVAALRRLASTGRIYFDLADN